MEKSRKKSKKASECGRRQKEVKLAGRKEREVNGDKPPVGEEKKAGRWTRMKTGRQEGREEGRQTKESRQRSM